MTRTVLSRRISSRRASLMAWANVSSRVSGRVDMKRHLIDGRIRRSRPKFNRPDVLGAHLVRDAVQIVLGGLSAFEEVARKALKRVFFAPEGFFVAGTVHAVAVAHAMPVITVG